MFLPSLHPFIIIKLVSKMNIPSRKTGKMQRQF
jgi:hypothetical protein